MEAGEKEVQKRDEALSTFLAKVDEVGSLVHDLTTSDGGAAGHAAIKRADTYLVRQSRDTRVVQDRTIVNTVAPESDVDKGTFVKTLEEDARERGERRKEREAKGQECKRRGNVAFRTGKFDTAVKEFSLALKHTPWDVSLYTNRALAYNRLGHYDDAIVDCEAAIQFEPCTLKAYVQKAKALTFLNREAEAMTCYIEAEKQFPNKVDFISGLRKTSANKKQ